MRKYRPFMSEAKTLASKLKIDITRKSNKIILDSNFVGNNWKEIYIYLLGYNKGKFRL